MDTITVVIQRQKNQDEKPYWQRFLYNGDVHIPVTTLLERLNMQTHLLDTEGKEAEPVKWACSCQQGLCGSCAMVVNGRPGLGCQIFCHDHINEKREIVIQPLSKFPVIRDLEVDRSEIFQVMKKMQLWQESPAQIVPQNVHFEYEVSQCLMCGCCLEVCPNYKIGDLFAGAPVAVAAVKLLQQERDQEHVKAIKKNYKKKFYRGCVKSLACQEICPMQIPTQRAISKSNRMSVWTIWNLLRQKL